ncbi:hypothetical protein TNCV_992461 [Trichonephila clavipes]|nr:hypothetical protein TNCV_992461 [Trichonephila clavipes]
MNGNEADTRAGTPLSKLTYYGNRRTDLTRTIAPLHGGSSVVQGLELVTRQSPHMAGHSISEFQHHIKMMTLSLDRCNELWHLPLQTSILDIAPTSGL